MREELDKEDHAGDQEEDCPARAPKKQHRHSRTAHAGLNGDGHAHDSRADVSLSRVRTVADPQRIIDVREVLYPMRAIRGVALCLSIVLTAGLSAQPRSSGDVLPFKATEKTLANGLRVIVVPTGFPNLVSVQIPVQTGSRNEVEPGKSGFAHFFEHVMFRGTPETPPEKYREIMSSAGARDNASTSDDFTRYYSTFAKEDLKTILGMYADMFKNLAYSESDFMTEARAVLGEYNKNSAEPLRSSSKSSASASTRRTPTSTRRWALSPTSRTCPASTRYSKVFFQRWYRPQSRPWSSRAT